MRRTHKQLEELQSSHEALQKEADELRNTARQYLELKSQHSQLQREHESLGKKLEATEQVGWFALCFFAHMQDTCKYSPAVLCACEVGWDVSGSTVSSWQYVAS